MVLKSGSDFREFSQVDVTFVAGQQPQFRITKHTITRETPHDPDMQALVEQFSELVDQGMEEELIYLDCDLDGRFSHVRTQETNLGNLVADIMRKSTRADAALFNSGSLRSDTIHEKGPLKMKVRRSYGLHLRCDYKENVVTTNAKQPKCLFKPVR